MSPKEAKVYLAMLESGAASIVDVATKTGLNRTTLYPVVERMLQNKLIFKSTKHKSGRFVAEKPEKLLARAKAVEVNLEQNMSVLKALQRHTDATAQIRYFEGPEAYKVLYEDSLLQPATSEVLAFMSVKNIWKYLPEEFSADYVQRRAKRNILARVIAINSPEARDLVKSAAREMRSIRLVPAYSSFPTDMQIYGNTLGLLSYEDNFFSVIIESAKIVQMQRAAFELMWEGAKKYQQDLPYYIYPNEIIL